MRSNNEMKQPNGSTFTGVPNTDKGANARNECETSSVSPMSRRAVLAATVSVLGSGVWRSAGGAESGLSPSIRHSRKDTGTR